MYLEIILSDFVYYMPNTVWYKFFDEKNLENENKNFKENFWENYENLIWRLVKIPFWKKEKFWLVINISDKPLDQNWKILDEKKIKEILEISPKNFSLDKKNLELIFKISKYYFSPLQQSASLFLPKKIFSPSENEIKKFLDEEKIFSNPEKILEKIFWEIKILEDKNKIKILKKNLEEIKKLEKEKKKIEKILELKNFLEKNNLNNKFKNYFNEENFLNLNEKQKEIFQWIQKNSKNFIHWITWSWKTEIYKHSVREILKEWKQACLLLPEIALTPQFLKTFEWSFDKRIIWVVHSKISPIKKAEIWHWVKSWRIKLIIWSRSALFLPWQDLWIICIDEAHEWTFKNNSSPNYRTQKIAEFYNEMNTNLQQNEWTKLIFWTATPDISDYYEFTKNWYKIYELNKRANWKPLPEMEIIDLKTEFALKNFSYISKKLEQEIWNTLKKNEQAILFLNQRWMHSSISCLECWNPVKCTNCEVSMTFHKKWDNQKLICHYCWKIENVWKCKSIVNWKVCWWENFKQIWIWTQKVAENVKKLFPNAKIKIADADNIKSKQDYDDLFQELKNWNIDILIWTQMITKWLDVENISLIWVILADMSLNIPDFKSEERTFQLLVQVAWRAWRWERNAKVLIQTFKEDHELIEIAKNYDFKKLYEKELETREILELPPFCEILKISLRDKNIKNLQERVKNILVKLEEVKKTISVPSPSGRGLGWGQMQKYLSTAQQSPHPDPLPGGEGDSGKTDENWNYIQTPEYITKLAQDFRKNPTSEEEFLWEILRNRKLDNTKFRRQYPIWRYIADFYCSELKLVIELDWKIHDKQKEYDEIRDEIISNQWIRILRVKNEELRNNLDSVINKIKQHTKNAASPSPSGRGLGWGQIRINSAPAVIPKIKNEFIWNLIIRWKNLEKFMEKTKNFDQSILVDCRIDRNPNNLS
jgi:primosomal protein N' (replication factor Y)